MMSYLSAGWPPAVHPPGGGAFESSAVAWLFDVLPPGYREQKSAHRYPVGLATIAASYGGVRRRRQTGVPDDPHPVEWSLSVGKIDAVLAAYGVEGTELVATARAVELVERALRGKLPVVTL